MFSFTFIFDQELGITLTQIVNDKLAKHQRGCSARVFVGGNDWVEGAAMIPADAPVTEACCTRRLAELLLVLADIGVAENHAANKHLQWLAGADSFVPVICQAQSDTSELLFLTLHKSYNLNSNITTNMPLEQKCMYVSTLTLADLQSNMQSG